MKILLLDNYDSFTYNLLHAVKELGCYKLLITFHPVRHLDAPCVTLSPRYSSSPAPHGC